MNYLTQKAGLAGRSLIILLALACGVGCARPGQEQTGTPQQATPVPATETVAVPTLAFEPTPVQEASPIGVSTAAPTALETSIALTPAGPAPTLVATPDSAALEDTYQNPVLRLNFPDPQVIQVDDMFYAYATNGSGRNVQLATSPDLVNWTLLKDAMPALAPWVRLSRPDVWAPEVIRIGEQFVLYYTARDNESGRQCIGVATSDHPEGIFRDPNERPLICQVLEGGSIDAHPFQDGDTVYLYWKNDGNCCGLATYIYVQQLAPDGLSLVGEPERLIRNDRPWEGAVVEAPTMFQYNDSYYLFYSANSYAGINYAVGYAICAAVTGPCEEAQENPILSSVLEQPLVVGPGHQDIIQVGDQTWIVYHAWEMSSAGLRTERRFLYIDRLEWEAGRPVVLGPTTDPQPIP